MIVLVTLFRNPLMGVFTDNEEIIKIGASVLLLGIWLKHVATDYMACGEDACRSWMNGPCCIVDRELRSVQVNVGVDVAQTVGEMSCCINSAFVLPT